MDLSDIPLSAGDRFIFCTDGVTRMLSDRDMKEVIGKASHPTEIVKGLVELAVRRGGPDNATAVAIIIDSV